MQCDPKNSNEKHAVISKIQLRNISLKIPNY